MIKRSPLTVFPAVATAFLLSSCVTPPPLPGLACDPDGRTNKITYGITNSRTILQVMETVKVKKDKALVFKLDPRGRNFRTDTDFKDAIVRIKGKSGSRNDWITLVEGSYNSTAGSKHTLAVCAKAPADPNNPYEYEVEVEDFGLLDPRVIVEPQ